MDFNLTKEQQDIVKAARTFALGEFPGRAVEFDREEKFDYAIWKKACNLGFVGIFIDEKYGGAGYGFFEHCLLNEEFWAVDPGIGSAILATTFGSELLQMVGTEEQKQLLLPRLVSGEAIMGTAITEPDAGCDVTGAVTTAVNTGDAWVINGSKMFATNGTVAAYMLIFCLTEPKNESPHRRHSFILVPTDTPRDSRPLKSGESWVSGHRTRPNSS
jgi:alkylation response protein AidB-like acyl-CoA dehydrogenase